MDTAEKDILAGFPGVRGMLESWQAQVAARLRGNPLLLFVVCVAFVGPLLRKLKLEGGLFHVFGATNTGKTSSLVVASSVWPHHPFAGSTSQSMVATWSSTGNAVEALAAERSETLLPLDEVGQFPGSGEELAHAIYVLGGSLGKVSLTNTRAVRSPRSFLTNGLSSGELSVRSKIEESGKRAPGGTGVRAVDIPAGTIVENTHGFDTPAAFVTALREAATENCGAPGVLYVDRLRKLFGDPDTEAALSVELRKMAALLLPPDATVEQGRVVRRFAAVQLAGTAAAELGILPFTEEEIAGSVRQVFERWWWETAHSISDEVRTLAALRSFVVRNHSSFLNTAASTGGASVRGFVSPRRDFFLFDEVQFQAACGCADVKPVLKALRERGLLVVNEVGRLRYKIKVASLGEEHIRLIAVKREILQFEFSGEDGAAPAAPQGDGATSEEDPAA